MPRIATIAALLTPLLLIPAAGCERAAHADGGPIISDTQHYDQGEVDWALPILNGRPLRLTGKMDVNFGNLYVQVHTPHGVTVFPREQLLHCGPVAQTPELGQ